MLSPFPYKTRLFDMTVSPSYNSLSCLEIEIAGCRVSSTLGASLIPTVVQRMVIVEELEDISFEIGGEGLKPGDTCGTVVLKEKGNGCIGGGGERGPGENIDQNSSQGRKRAKNRRKNKARGKKEIAGGHRSEDDADGVETEGDGGEFQSTKYR